MSELPVRPFVRHRCLKWTGALTTIAGGRKLGVPGKDPSAHSASAWDSRVNTLKTKTRLPAVAPSTAQIGLAKSSSGARVPQQSKVTPWYDPRNQDRQDACHSAYTRGRDTLRMSTADSQRSRIRCPVSSRASGGKSSPPKQPRHGRVTFTVLM